MSGEVTNWLHQLRKGDRDALDHLIPVLYEELRRLAAQRLRRERASHTLSTTALVNEAYLKLLKRDQIFVEDRGQFLAVAGETMRRLLVDYARARKSRKRGSGIEPVPLEEAPPLLSERGVEEMLDLDRALERLENANPRGCAVAKHRLFAGLTATESAQLLGVSTKTAQRDWIVARAWLRSEISRDLIDAPGVRLHPSSFRSSEDS